MLHSYSTSFQNNPYKIKQYCKIYDNLVSFLFQYLKALIPYVIAKEEANVSGGFAKALDILQVSLPITS